MTNPYSSQTLVNYNTSPPSDDASATEANRVKWATHKDKLGDPLKTFTEAINTEVLAAFGELPFFASVSVSASRTQLAADERKVVACSNTITYTLLASATAGLNFMSAIKNNGTGAVTIVPDGSETIDGKPGLILGENDSVIIWADGSNWLLLATSQEAVGTVREYIGPSAPGGWLLLEGGTIGNASSGGTALASAIAEPLFTLLWDSMADAQAPVSSGRGASAAADFAADKTITLPDARGRTIIGTGTGSGLTARTHGDTDGAETHTLTEGEMPSHFHTVTGSNTSSGSSNDIGMFRIGAQNSENTDSKGSDDPHNNMQPWLALRKIIKL